MLLVIATTLATLSTLCDFADGTNSKNTVDYLTQFGYLPQSETEAQGRKSFFALVS